MAAPRPVVPGLWRLPLGGVNAYLLESSGGLVLVDAGNVGSAEGILEAARYLDRPIREVVVTHHHPDHVGGLAEVQRRTGARTWAHGLDAPLVRQGLAVRDRFEANPGWLDGWLFRLFIGAAPRRVEPAEVHETVEDSDWLPMAGGLLALHTPGHSAGHLALLWPEHGGVLLAADAAMHVPTLRLSLGHEDLPTARRSLRRLGRRDFQVAVFGHGRPILHGAGARFRRTFGVAEYEEPVAG